MDSRLVTKMFPHIDNRKRAMQLKIDRESVHYISLREDAHKISCIIAHHLDSLEIEYDDAIITDATAGVGGDTLSFGLNFGHVHAIEIDELRYDYLVNNINVYNLKNITPYHDDCKDVINSIDNHHVVFMDPPWGGRSYKKHEKLKLTLGNKSIEDYCNTIFDSNKTKHPPKLIVLKLPTNYDLVYLYKNIKCDKIILHELKKMYIVAIYSSSSGGSSGGSSSVLS